MTSPMTDLRTLRSLQETAPTTLAPAVLAQIGLGDSYASMESPLGTVLVAWSKEGITSARAARASSVSRANSSACCLRFRSSSTTASCS